MKFRKVISISAKAIYRLLTVLFLIPAAVVMLIYSPWSQDLIRRYIISLTADGPMRVEIASLRLRFPLEIELDSVNLVMEDAATAISADRLEASVRVMPLLKGRADINEARMYRTAITLGAPDSAMYMTINADSLSLKQSSLRFTDMNIEVADGRIAHGGVNMLLNPIETPPDTATTEPSAMKIGISRISLEDFTYNMRMLPVIDSLGTHLSAATMENGVIDMASQSISIGSFTGNGMDVAYITPDSATVAATPVVPPSESTSAPWTVTIDSVGFGHSSALYTTHGVVPTPGLDFTYIKVDSLDIGVNDFYNRASTVTVPLRVSGIERCGVELSAAGTLAVDSLGTGLQRFAVTTGAGTDLRFSGLLGMGDMTTDPSTALALDLDGIIAPADLRLMFPTAAPIIAGLPSNGMVTAHADIKGTSGDLAVNDLGISVNGVARIAAKGRISNVFDTDHLGGDITLAGSLIDLNPLKNKIFDRATATTVNIPRTTLSGNVRLSGGRINGSLTGVTGEGRINLRAFWNRIGCDYDIDLTTDRFPVNAFLPDLGIGPITAAVKANGHGYDPFAPTMRLDADLEVIKAVYDGHVYDGITGRAKVADGYADISLSSANPDAEFDLHASGNLEGDTYEWSATLDGVHVNPAALGLMPAVTSVEAALSATATITPASDIIDARLDLSHLNYTDSIGTIRLNNITATLNTSDSTVNATLHNRDLSARFSTPVPLDTLITRMDSTSAVLAELTARRTIDVQRVQRALPPFDVSVNAGTDNAINDIMAESRMSFRALSLNATNAGSLGLEMGLEGFKTASMALDTITFDISQYGPRMAFTGRIDNRPGTFDEWAHARLDGFMADNRLRMMLSQHNIAGRQGYAFGLAAELADSTVTVSVDPTDPTIAYQPWTVNDDNFILWNFEHKHIDANLHMHGAGSSLAIYTNHIPGQDDHQEELVVDITDINIADWVNINPFAPPMAGRLSANIKVSEDDGDIRGNGTVTLADLTYDRRRVGTIGADLDISTDLGGHIRAQAGISIDNVKTITIAGALNDSTAGSPLALDFSMIHFPLTAVNPFLPRNMASLTGTLNGSMYITGTGGDPAFDGWLQFDSTAVRVGMLATTYPVSSVRIPVDNNVVTLRDFAITGVNGRPMSLNGEVDLHSMADPKIDLQLTADQFQLCDSRKATRGADIYGKGFISLDASVKGNMQFMRVKADMNILPGTNITYVMSNAETAIQSHSVDELVKFVNFADTGEVTIADSVVSSAMAVMLQASLTVSNGATINVDLSTDGKNKVRLLPEGTVNLSMLPFSDPRLTGRLNINSGFARYTPPFMSEKLFNFENGSYVSFNGNMLDPILNITAANVIKANVTQSGQNSRLINFDVKLSVTGTLNNMNVAFDLATDDDATVANELSSMSPSQRANQAMNMLLYNVYTGPGTTGNANLSGNALYSFLTSQLNSWAARTIKGVDLSFGVDQYDRTINGSTSSTMSYSYQVSKSLFNDRFKIIVGGNYSTDANADENFSQNLIKDISFEYFLNNARTMYLRLFRHTGYESILEGEITRTGVGFVYRRKLVTLRNLFGHRRKSPAQTPPTDESK